ncbi:MAG: type II toxin-antitoxin system PemK/MazF family toxin [Acidobacteria bacterium]|nr:type II toxin-antitoxin system PemK/MazF family toxin [Acidobacteriota bacterium]MBI3422032.1 type II toxin-antitoxin system PemK/MazF family toxin [Acidobacteriota bacterium]
MTDEIKPHSHIVLAFITSQVSASASPTDFVIDKSDADFATTGLKVSSTIRLHRLMTVTKSIVLRQLGELSLAQQTEIENRLRKLFSL